MAQLANMLLHTFVLLSTFVSCILVTLIAAGPSAKYVLHEKRSSLPYGWQKHGRLHSDYVLPMRVALTQSNLHKGYEHLMDVSHPESPNYGKHWSAHQVAEAFAPAQGSVDSVLDWLKSWDISGDRVSQSQSLGWLHFNATVQEAERLLKTKYHLHRHGSGKPHVACDEYHLPTHLRRHIDFITPTIHFDTKVSHAVRKRATVGTAGVGKPVESKAAVNEITQPANPYAPKKLADVDIDAMVDELEMCNQQTTPDCLRALYDIPFGKTSNPQNSFGVTAFTPYAYSQSDLDSFFARFSQNQSQRTPDVQLINAPPGTAENPSAGFTYLSEPDLDLEYAMALVNPANVTLYQVGDRVQGASFNNFLDALDASYCTFDGGDDPSQDAVYPSGGGGYQGPRACGGFAATKVISTSYGYNEADLTPRYEARQCNEYMKLGLTGVSFFFSSGDYGVGGNYGQCLTLTNGTNSTSLNDGSSGQFNPAFPSTCPYVTSVGATQIPPGGSVNDPEEAIQLRIKSGGGFSNVFPLPAYQSAAILSYFRSSAPAYGPDRFNDSRATRGYPDISANGAAYVTAVSGSFSLLSGTSASAPTVAGVFALINEARAEAGKGSVGFVNPVLYVFPGDLNDVKAGGNAGCGTSGFQSVEGWDPVTGLGTPNYPKLAARFGALP